jgi:uncharacterized protein
MHVTLHLTNACNMRCAYCYVDHGNAKAMALETAKKATDLAISVSAGKPAGIVFFGGEPLLYKELIYRTVAYADEAGEREGASLYCKLTTNGLLLNEAFLDYADSAGIYIALSHDGAREAHDAHRRDWEGRGTFDRVSEAAIRLLKHQPSAPVMMTVNPDTVMYYAKSVDTLFQMGFCYIICSLNYAGRWDGAAWEELGKQYEALSRWYVAHTKREDKFYLSPFESKIASHIQGEDWCKDRCELGMKQVSVHPSGMLYPCVQFAGDAPYAIGSVEAGIDRQRQAALFNASRTEQAECRNCGIRRRCLNTCGCLNKQVTGRLDRVAPSLCMHERILLPIADRTAEKLYKKRSALFIQKHYNELYPIVSMVEERTSKAGK